MLTLMSGSAAVGLVVDLLVILGAASLISVLLRRLHLAAIPGYLIVGAVIGSLPGPFHLIQDPGNVEQISGIAIILLMFTIGLHLDMDAIRNGMTSILTIGLISTLATALVMWPIGMAFGLSAPAALTIAMALSMSSTAVSIGILQKNKEVHLVHGRLCFGVAIVQDLLSIPLLALMPAIAVWAGAKGLDAPVGQVGANLDSTSQAIHLISQGCLAVGGIIAMLGFAKYLLPILLREASWGGNTEGLLVASAGAGLSAAVLTGFLGFGPALGAFLAGFMLSSTPFRYQLAGQLSPMRDLFMAVFFTAVGIKLNLFAIGQFWWVILLAVTLTMSIKALVISFTTWAGGTTAPVAALVGLILCQAGEFSLVVMTEAAHRGIVTDQTHSIIIALVVISLVLTTPAADYGRKLGPRLSSIRPAKWIANPTLRDHRPHAPEPIAGGATPALPPINKNRHVIIAGFGVVGRNLAEHFAARDIPFTIVDLNASTIMRQKALGRKAVFGDIANADVLESAGIHDAEAAVVTIPDDSSTIQACKAIREMRPDIFISVRTSYLSKAIAAHEVGADHVTIEEVVTAQDMAVKVIEELSKRYAARDAEIPHL